MSLLGFYQVTSEAFSVHFDDLGFGGLHKTSLPDLWIWALVAGGGSQDLVYPL